MSEAYKKMTSHGSISIPVAMRRELGIEGKDPMIVESNGGRITISPYRPRCLFCGVPRQGNLSGVCGKGNRRL